MSKKFKVSLKFILPGLISALGAQSELDALDRAGDGGLIRDDHFSKKLPNFWMTKKVLNRNWECSSLGLTVEVGSIDSGCLSDSIDSDITH